MSEIALAMFYLITNFLELLGNVIRALLHPSVNPKDVWNLFYSAGSFHFWVAKAFFGEGGAFDIAKENTTAMKHFAELVNYAGKNATKIFGTTETTAGLSKVLSYTESMIDENFVAKLLEVLRGTTALALKMLRNLDSVLG
ncbi:MAG: hypothetical protein QXX76_04390 [Archaeoglobaceae archaeon]